MKVGQVRRQLLLHDGALPQAVLQIEFRCTAEEALVRRDLADVEQLLSSPCGSGGHVLNNRCILDLELLQGHVIGRAVDGLGIAQVLSGASRLPKSHSCRLIFQQGLCRMPRSGN